MCITSSLEPGNVTFFSVASPKWRSISEHSSKLTCSNFANLKFTRSSLQSWNRTRRSKDPDKSTPSSAVDVKPACPDYHAHRNTMPCARQHRRCSLRPIVGSPSRQRSRSAPQRVQKYPPAATAMRQWPGARRHPSDDRSLSSPMDLRPPAPRQPMRGPQRN
jgi:hypothetical protein